MKRWILPRIAIVLWATCGTPLLAAGDPDSKGDSQPGGNPNQLLRQDAPLEVLIEALQSKDFNTRSHAVDFLGYRGEAAQEAVPALVKTLDDSHLPSMPP